MPQLQTLDQDGVMLALTARSQALQVLPTKGIKVINAGEDKRRFVVGDHQLGDDSFGAMCKFLDVPAYFMERAPLDLANTVAARMVKEPAAEGRELVFNATTQRLAGNRPKGKKVVPAVQVFERVFSALPETGEIHLYETDDAVDVQIVTRSVDIEPRKGDLVHGGLSCLYSEIGTKQAVLRAYSERLVCTNGMTHREFDHQFGTPKDLDTFFAELETTVQACIEFVQQQIEPKMRRAVETNINGPQAIRRIFKAARLNPRYLDAVLAAHALEDDGTAFGVLQAFTRAANTLAHEMRTRLQVLAGDELVAIEKAHCPACYAAL